MTEPVGTTRRQPVGVGNCRRLRGEREESSLYNNWGFWVFIIYQVLTRFTLSLSSSCCQRRERLRLKCLRLRLRLDNPVKMTGKGGRGRQ